MQGTKPTLRGNHSNEKHSKVCHEISTGNTEGDRIHTPEVLPPRIIKTEVNNCNSVSGFKTKRSNEQGIDKVGFINGNEDTHGLCCPSVWDKSFSEHFDVKTEFSHWVKTENSNSFLDINIHPSTNNGDDSLSKILRVVSTPKSPGVKMLNQSPIPELRD